MNKEWQIVIAGSGGQGLMLAGNILSWTATQKEDRNATQRNFYGPEKRGGYASTEVKISDEEIIFPNVEEADVIILLHQAAANEYAGRVTENMTVIYDSTEVDISVLKEKPKHCYGIPMTDMIRSIHAVQSLNIMALGALCRLTGVVKEENMLALVCESFPKNTELNTKAFKMGAESIEQAMPAAEQGRVSNGF